MAAPVSDAKSRLALVDESTYGTFPGSPTYIHTPVETYGVRMKSEVRAARPFTGILQHKHTRPWRGNTSGSIQVPLYGWRPSGLSTSLAEYLMTWAMGSPETVARASKSAEWAEGPDIDNKRHTGLVVSSFELNGSEQSGIVELNLELVGKDESTVSTAQTVPNTRNKLLEFQFSDATFAIGGVAVNLRDFSFKGQYSPELVWLGATRPRRVISNDAMFTLAMTIEKADSTYTAMRRATTGQEFTGQIVVKGLHNGTGTGGTDYAIATIDFPVLSFTDKDDTGQRMGVRYETLNMNVLKPDTSSAAFAVTWSEGS